MNLYICYYINEFLNRERSILDKLKKIISEDLETSKFLCNLILFIVGILFTFSTEKLIYLAIYIIIWFGVIFLKCWINSNFNSLKFKLEIEKTYENYILHNVIFMMILVTFIGYNLRNKSTNEQFLFLMTFIISAIIITLILIRLVKYVFGKWDINVINLLSFIFCLSILGGVISIPETRNQVIINKIIIITYTSDMYIAFISDLKEIEKEVKQNYKMKSGIYAMHVIMTVGINLIRIFIVSCLYNSNNKFSIILAKIIIALRLFDHLNNPKNKDNCIPKKLKNKKKC